MMGWRSVVIVLNDSESKYKRKSVLLGAGKPFTHYLENCFSNFKHVQKMIISVNSELMIDRIQIPFFGVIKAYFKNRCNTNYTKSSTLMKVHLKTIIPHS